MSSFMPQLKPRFRIGIITLMAILAIIAYYSSGYFFVYNNDAYVDANLIHIASNVSGHITYVGVTDNQTVTKGRVLPQLDQRPFTLGVLHAKARLVQAIAQKHLLQSELKKAQADIDAKQAAYALAQREWQRYHVLYQQRVVSHEQMNEKTEQRQVAQAVLIQAQEEKDCLIKSVAVDDAAIAQARSQLALKEYDLNQSTLRAPANGRINHLRVYPGDYAQAGQTLFGFINAHSWHIIANIRESNLVGIHPGKQVWVYLASRPWHLYRGTVTSIGGGVAREPLKPNPGLPYATPVTSWIRYDYRIPVHIVLPKLPHTLRLYMGTDAKVFAFL